MPVNGVTQKLLSLDPCRLVLLTYVTKFDEDETFSIKDLYHKYPFVKYLVSPDSNDLDGIMSNLCQDGFVTIQNEMLRTYRRVRDVDPGDVWESSYTRLISVDKSFFRDRVLEIRHSIRLNDLPKLERSFTQQAIKDPFFSSFCRDTRIGREGWWSVACQLANLYKTMDRQETVAEFFFKFIEKTGLHITLNQDRDVFSDKLDTAWARDGVFYLKAVVDNITPWRDKMAIQIIFVRLGDLSFNKRDQIKNDVLKSLLEDAAIAHMVLPVGVYTKRNQEMLESTQLIRFTPEDSLDIFIHRKPPSRFRELLRERMDIELLSPYQITWFVPEVMFYGRDYEIRLISAHPKTNYAIYGGRQSGKTSLMKQLERLYSERCTVVFIDCYLIDCEQDFWSKLCRGLNLDIEPGDSYQRFLAVRKNIGSETLLLIDEVDQLFESCSPNRIIGVLRNLNAECDTRCIIAGTTELYKEYKNLHSPMYNFADPLLLGPFKENEAISLAKDPMSNLGVIYERGDSTIKQLVHRCGFFPNLIQKMCYELVKKVKAKQVRTITSAMLDEVFEGEEFGGYVSKQFQHNFNPYQKLIVFAALMVQSMPLSVIVEKVQEYHNLSMDKIENLLDELVLLFILKKDSTIGNQYSWVYEGFPKILKKRSHDVKFRIQQIVKEIEGKTKIA